jgi:diaminopimelate decarboxylase
VKHVPGIRTYVSVDGGMGDNPRHILYGAEYVAKLANKPAAPATETIAVAGRCCESGDMLIKAAQLPPCEAGDIMAVSQTGAYNYSMPQTTTGFPSLRGPGQRGKARTIVKRQSYEQLVENDMMAPWQK